MTPALNALSQANLRIIKVFYKFVNVVRIMKIIVITIMITAMIMIMIIAMMIMTIIIINNDNGNGNDYDYDNYCHNDYDDDYDNRWYRYDAKLSQVK